MMQRILALLSKKFSTTIDMDFLSQQIKLLVVKHNIRSKNILNIIKEYDIFIQSRAFDQDVGKLHTLVGLYAAIELCGPLDMLFFKKKQALNRRFMLNLKINNI